MEAKAESINLNCRPAPIYDYIECPNCESKLSKSEIARHCEEEMERLRQQESIMEARVLAENAQNESEDEQKRRKSRSVFNRVRGNRQSRMKVCILYFYNEKQFNVYHLLAAKKSKESGSKSSHILKQQQQHRAIASLSCV